MTHKQAIEILTDFRTARIEMSSREDREDLVAEAIEYLLSHLIINN